jgi:glycosyltransferase involved in cell wall biosynthesis
MNIQTACLALSSLPKNLLSSKQLFLISEPAHWSIYEDCRNIQKNLSKIISPEISYLPFGLKKKVIHFVSENTLIGNTAFKNEKWYEKIHPSNKLILTWYHISDQDTSRLHLIPLLNEFVDYVHTASHNTEQKLIRNGLREEKIKVVPLGVDLNAFHPVSPDRKRALRKKLCLPLDKIIIGSFQKDGIGWGEGLEPKLIKGPDIFCDAVESLTTTYPLHVLLTGPARGYVKKRLERSNIPYTHVFLDQFESVAEYYQVLDLYLVTSREEGGPKALLESLASGIPFVSTAVGMVSEVIIDGLNGFVVLNGDVSMLVEKAKRILASPGTRADIIRNGLESIKSYNMEKTTYAMYTQMYKPLLEKL